eukprot:3894692-Amphidinium_carterae.1
MEKYYTDMKRLEMTLRLDYEEDHGKIDESEEFITALENKEDKTLKPMLYQYAKDLPSYETDEQHGEKERSTRTTGRRRNTRKR